MGFGIKKGQDFPQAAAGQYKGVLEGVEMKNIQQTKLELDALTEQLGIAERNETRQRTLYSKGFTTELKLEDAFFIVKAKADTLKMKARDQELANQKASRAQTLRKTAPGSNVTPSGTPKFKDAWEAYSYHIAMSK